MRQTGSPVSEDTERIVVQAAPQRHSQTCNHWTALMYASFRGLVEIVEKLLALGADPGLKTRGSAAQQLDAGLEHSVNDVTGILKSRIFVQSVSKCHRFRKGSVS